MVDSSFGDRLLVELFRTSRPSIEALAAKLRAEEERSHRNLPLFRYEGSRRIRVSAPPSAFYLRTSVEYASPQLTLEELQGILLARLLEVAGAFVADHPHADPEPSDIRAMRSALERPPTGRVVPFLMNVDDIEADRYSVNPLRRSIVESGQSAKAVAEVRCAGLALDDRFLRKYSGSLVTAEDAAEIRTFLQAEEIERYVDLVDATKYAQLARLSGRWGIDLGIPALRMPLTVLEAESTSGPLHRLISAVHAGPDSLARIYDYFGRSFRHNPTFLPVIPHAPDGSASKRLASGGYRLHDHVPTGVRVSYGSRPLYPNEVDPSDVAWATAEATVEVPWTRLTRYDYRATPASPQFALYMLLSPEDGALWHGVGRYAGAQIVRSYTAFHAACHRGEPFEGVSLECRPDPLQWDLVADSMLRHPVFGNIDASVTCVPHLEEGAIRSVVLRVLADPLGVRSLPKVRGAAEEAGDRPPEALTPTGKAAPEART